MKAFFTFFLFFALFLSPITVLAKAKPSLSAKHAVLLDAVNGDFLWEKNADTPVPMASTTKIATAIAVLEALPLDREITVDERSVGVEQE